VVPALVALLNNGTERSDVRFSAARALGKIGDADCILTLIHALRDKQVPDVIRQDATRRIGLSRNTQGIEALRAVLNDTTEPPALRAATMEPLKDFDGETALAMLTRIAKSRGDSDKVRTWAAFFVVELTDGAVDDAEVVEPLRGYVDLSEDITAMAERPDELRGAREKVARNGTSWAARNAARRLLGLPPAYLGPLLAFWGIVLIAWLFAHLRAADRGRRSVWLHVASIAVLAFGTPLIIAFYSGAF
jgi:HEAT repeat protein